jgi:hypothetical protein
MNRLSMKHIILLMVLIFAGVTICDGQAVGKSKGKDHEKALVGKHKKVKTKKVRVKTPKAKKEQEKKDAKFKKDYFNFLADSRKRAYEIQSPKVKERMNQDKKDIKARDKHKKKKSASSTKGAQKKYKK